jgi:SH3-like domain-containing protein
MIRPGQHICQDLRQKSRPFSVLGFAGLIILLHLALLPSAAVWAATIGGVTGLPLPRFVSLRASEVNIRTGPGVRYPIDWVFNRANLPVEVIAEFDTWRKIRDADGTKGWVHQSMLSGRRYIITTDRIRSLRRKPAATASTVARLEAGVVGRLETCREKWCEIDIDGLRGWILRTEVWGLRTAKGGN